MVILCRCVETGDLVCFEENDMANSNISTEPKLWLFIIPPQ